jgi:ABC-2 type transport system ATP-binding protein
MIKIENLHKNYDTIEAVKGISLNIESGEMFGIIGPDGAGKTTTIKILCGLINPLSGNIYLMDKNINKERSLIQSNIGYLSQKFSLYRDLTIDENIEFFASIHNIKDFQEKYTKYLEYFINKYGEIKIFYGIVNYSN